MPSTAANPTVARIDPEEARLRARALERFAELDAQAAESGKASMVERAAMRWLALRGHGLHVLGVEVPPDLSKVRRRPGFLVVDSWRVAPSDEHLPLCAWGAAWEALSTARSGFRLGWEAPPGRGSKIVGSYAWVRVHHAGSVVGSRACNPAAMASWILDDGNGAHAGSARYKAPRLECPHDAGAESFAVSSCDGEAEQWAGATLSRIEAEEIALGAPEARGAARRAAL